MNFIARIEKNRPAFETLLKQTAEMNKKIPMELTDKEALDIWRSLNYYMPAGDRIRKIKRTMLASSFFSLNYTSLITYL